MRVYVHLYVHVRVYVRVRARVPNVFGADVLLGTEARDDVRTTPQTLGGGGGG